MCSAGASRSSSWTLSASTPTATSPRAPAPSTVASTGASPPKRPRSSWRSTVKAARPDRSVSGGLERASAHMLKEAPETDQRPDALQQQEPPLPLNDCHGSECARADKVEHD